VVKIDTIEGAINAIIKIINDNFFQFARILVQIFLAFFADYIKNEDMRFFYKISPGLGDKLNSLFFYLGGKKLPLCARDSLGNLVNIYRSLRIDSWKSAANIYDINIDIIFNREVVSFTTGFYSIIIVIQRQPNAKEAWNMGDTV